MLAIKPISSLTDSYRSDSPRIMKNISVWLALFLCGFALPAAAERMAVSGSVANIRSGPGTSFPILWKIEKYHPVKIIEKKGTWYHFEDFERDRGWIHRSLLNKTRTVITRKKACNLRSGPGTKHAVVFTVGKGIPFRVVKRSGKWVLVEHYDGDRGWIHRSLVW